MTRAPDARLRLVGLAALAATALGLALAFPVRDRLSAFVAWIDGLGAWGPVLLALAYVPACVLFVPGSLLTLGGGWAFGLPAAFAAVSLGSTTGACAAFLLGRTLARGAIEGRVAADRRFRAIDRAVGREGFKIVLLTRLSPVFPFNLLNYAYGLTSVSFRDYLLASWLGMLPGTLLFVYLGSAAKSLAELAAGGEGRSPAEWAFFWGGLAATVVATAFVTRVARKALKEAAE